MAGFRIPNAADAAFPDQAEPDAGDYQIIQQGLTGLGLVQGGTCAAQGTPNMTVAVSAGRLVSYAGPVDFAAGTATITTAHATLPRFDIIWVSDTGVITVTAGTATANPVFPQILDSHTVLASVYVPAAATSITSSQIIDKRVFVRQWYNEALARTDAGPIPSNSGAYLYTDEQYRLQARDANGADALVDLRKVNGQTLRHWRSALAGRDFVPANIYVVGDSMTEGFGQLAFNRRWLDVFRDALQREYRPGGEGFVPVVSGATMTFTQPWTIQGTPDQTDFGYGLGRRAIILNTTDDIITRNFYGDRVFVMYTGGSALGTMKITIDGVASTQATGNPESLVLSGRIWDSGQLALGTHTLRIEPNAASNTVVIDGTMVMATDYAAGVHVWEGARSGYTAAHFKGDADATRQWADAMFQPHTYITASLNGVTGNGTTTITWSGGSFDANDVGEVMYGQASSNFPRAARIVSVTNATTVVLSETVPSGTHTPRCTRARVTNAVTNGTALITSATAAFNAWDVGKSVSGTDIPAGSVIKRVLSSTEIWINQIATGAGSGRTLQIKNRQKYPVRPDLLMIELGLNDQTVGVTKATFKTNMQAIVQTAIYNGRIDQPSMAGIYNDETPSVALMSLWAPSSLNTAHQIAVGVTNGSPLVTAGTSTTPRFTQDDVGRTITTVGNSPIPAGTTILSVQGLEAATLSQNATATNTNATATIVNRRFNDEMWVDFRQTMYELCIENDWVFFDLYNLGGWIGVNDDRNLTFDNLHPNDRGAQWIADEMAMSIGGVKKLASIPQGLFDYPGEMIVAESAEKAGKKPGMVRKVSADTASGTTAGVMVDITELAFRVGPNETVSFIFNLFWTAAATTSGILFDFNPAAGVSAPVDLIIGGWGPNGTAPAPTAGQWYGRQDAVWGTDLTIPSSTTSGTTLPSMIQLMGQVTAGAVGGLITPRFGPEAAAATTLQRGSWALIL